MTIKERDELLADAEDIYTDLDGITGKHWQLLRRIILALPVDEPAKVQVGRSCPCGAYEASDVRLVGVQPDGTVSVQRGGVYHVCPPQPKPSMSAAVRELVRAAEEALPDVQYSDEQFRLGNAIAAVKDLFVEEPE